jgi:hypothetical protein
MSLVLFAEFEIFRAFSWISFLGQFACRQLTERWMYSDFVDIQGLKSLASACHFLKHPIQFVVGFCIFTTFVVDFSWFVYL